jgi:hypothetical protein
MLENQFIQFGRGINPQDESIVMPTLNGLQTTFFVDTELGIGEIDIVTADGSLTLKKKAVNKYTDGWCELYDLNSLAIGDCYRLKANMSDGTSMYSNILRRDDVSNQLSTIQYYCKEPAFGFPFSGGKRFIQQLMPINLYSPQFKQEDKVYTKRNGEQVVLFANITKEYEGETDYIPMEWHEKILIALSCDEVYINGERVTKSGNYEIDHDNCTYSDCGIKLMRATFKVTTNVTQRNSNY